MRKRGREGMMNLEGDRQGEAKKGQKGRGAGQGLASAYYPAFRFGAKPVTRSPERASPSSWMHSGPETAPLPQLPPSPTY